MIEPDAAEMEAQGLQSAGVDHAHATELMAEAGVTLPGDEAVPEGSTPVEAVEPAEAAPADAAAAAVGPVEPAGSAAAAEPASGEPAEPILIEVWRLHRHHHARRDRATPVAGRTRGAARAPMPPPAPLVTRTDRRARSAGRTRRRGRIRAPIVARANPTSAGVRRAATGHRRAARTTARGRARSIALTSARIAARSGAKRRRIRTPPSPSSSP